jgi:hypothetical protein
LFVFLAISGFVNSPVTAGLPLLWITWVAMFGGYDPRFIGLGSEEFRRIITSGISRDRDRVLRLETGRRPRSRSHRPSGLGRLQYGRPGRDAQATAPAAPAWTLHAPGDGRRPRQCGRYRDSRQLPIIWAQRIAALRETHDETDSAGLHGPDRIGVGRRAGRSMAGASSPGGHMLVTSPGLWIATGNSYGRQ